MVPVQPTKLWQYLSFAQHSVVAPGVKEYFYASWEDALWDVLKQKNIPAGAVTFVPEFFCKDVVKNMQTHGLKVVWYPVDENFQTEPRVFAEWLEKYSPQIVVVFHAVGIQNRLLLTPEKWLSAFPSSALLIEDCVHQLLDPSEVAFIHSQHIVMDSLRKVVPLAGAHLFCREDFQFVPSKRAVATVGYEVGVIGWWLIFQVCLFFGSVRWSAAWQHWWLFRAEAAMLKGYDLIGDSYAPGFSSVIFQWLFRFVNHKEIRKVKAAQVAQYEKGLLLNASTKVQKIIFSEHDAGRLRGFPVRLARSVATVLVKRIRDKGLLLREELADSIWSQRQRVVYLPLGAHLSQADVEQVIEVVNQAVAEL